MHWTRSRGKYVYIFRSKNKMLPRRETKFLDAMPNEFVDAYVKELARKAGLSRGEVLSDAKLTSLVSDYLRYITNRGKSPATVSEHRRSLLEFAIPFFLAEGLTDVNSWPSCSIKLLPYLEEQAIASLAVKVNGALKGFWRWMLDEGVVVTGADIRLRYPVKEKKTTPLQFSLTPEEVIEWANSATTKPHFGLMALIGYFFSLRPQELFALQPSDFRGGKELELECSRVMKRAGLDGRLVVNVTRQRTKHDSFEEPKAGSNGWVACFSKQGADEIARRLKALPRDKPLFPDKNDSNFRAWKKSGIPNMTLKDLRRSSIYFLGHYSKLEIAGIRSHARHSYLSTTALYLRRIEEQLETRELDLEA